MNFQNFTIPNIQPDDYGFSAANNSIGSAIQGAGKRQEDINMVLLKQRAERQNSMAEQLHKTQMEMDLDEWRYKQAVKHQAEIEKINEKKQEKLNEGSSSTAPTSSPQGGSQSPIYQAPKAPLPQSVMSLINGGQGDMQGNQVNPIAQQETQNSGGQSFNPVSSLDQDLPETVLKLGSDYKLNEVPNPAIKKQEKDIAREDKNVKTATDYLVNSLKTRSGTIGIQNNKVDAALHARQLINQAYDPATGRFNVTQVPYAELSESVGTLVSSTPGASEHRINSLKQDTAEGRINKVITFFTGKPSNATSQEALHQLVDIIDRQGLTSEDLRDTPLEELKKLPVFSRISKENQEMLKSQRFGNSYREQMKSFPDKMSKDALFIQNAKAHGYSDQDIQDYLSKKK